MLCDIWPGELNIGWSMLTDFVVDIISIHIFKTSGVDYDDVYTSLSIF